MQNRNILIDLPDPLEMHQDDRGLISDIFYNSNINHVAFIKTKPNKIRGNHYHKQTTQHILITKGSLEYWYKNSKEVGESKFVLMKQGDIVTTPPFEIHALKILENGNEFIVFSEGLRGGSDYEKDTFRVPNIIKG
jgi:dTDP-4-dehydrorhamnose 3,5-epimerase-like enzyme